MEKSSKMIFFQIAWTVSYICSSQHTHVRSVVPEAGMEGRDKWLHHIICTM